MVLATLVRGVDGATERNDLLVAADFARSVRHPHVLAFLEGHVDDECLSLVSEYLDGEPLGLLLAHATAHSMPFPQNVALKIIRDVIATLSRLAIEARPMVTSGGLSAESVFVASYGEAMLRHPMINEVAMRRLAVRRHPAALPYRSPEQLRAPRKIDERADVFSAGVLLWEMLAGRPLFGLKSHRQLGRLRAFSEAEAREVEGRIRMQEVPDLGRVHRAGGALHDAVATLVQRALERDPAHRFSSLEEMVRAIDALPRGLVADAVAVAGTVERLAGTQIARRQQCLAEVAPIPLHSSAPPSDRVTAFPEESNQVTVAIPRQLDEGRLHRLVHSASQPPARGAERDGASAGPPPPIELPSLKPRARQAGGWLLVALGIMSLAGATYGTFEVIREESAQKTPSGGEGDERSPASRSNPSEEQERDLTPPRQEASGNPQAASADSALPLHDSDDVLHDANDVEWSESDPTAPSTTTPRARRPTSDRAGSEPRQPARAPAPRGAPPPKRSQTNQSDSEQDTFRPSGI